MEEKPPLLSVQKYSAKTTQTSCNSSESNENGAEVRVPYPERKPFTRASPLHRDNYVRSPKTVERSATFNRYKYYSVLHRDKEELVIPEHVLPPELFLVVSKSRGGIGNQSSWVTIFSLWNTMMGTSLLSMPWAVSQAGFAGGIFFMIFVAGLAFYTARQIINFASRFSAKERETLEFSDICRTYLGRWGNWTAFLFSLSAIFGALIVYYVLMSEFLYNTGHFIHERLSPSNITSSSHSSTGQVLCPSNGSSQSTTSRNGFYRYWDQQKTVPFFLTVIVFPLMNVKSPSFFTKFNALGTVSVIYVVIFTIYKCSVWGINVDFTDSSSVHATRQIEMSFPALCGTLTLAFFIHNCVLSITRYQKHPANNDRDLFIAYVLVALTYSVVGFVFYITFPLKKSCIEQVLLQNFRSSDGMTFGVRLVLLFQMITVLPLLVYIIRIQIMNFTFGKPYPSFVHILVLNIFVTLLCIIFARLYPHVGNIIRFVGAFCGLAYIYTLPPVIYLVERNRDGKLTRASAFMHCCIIAVGVLNFIGQIVISVCW